MWWCRNSALALIFWPVVAAAQPTSMADLENLQANKLPVLEQHAFKRGERLEYNVSYGWIDAGEAILELTTETKTIGGRPVYHAVGTGRSLGTFDFFFEVRDRYESYFDVEGIYPWLFIRDVSEGGYQIKQNYTFDHYRRIATNEKGKQFKVSLGIQDMISSFYRARAMDLAGAKPGDVFEMDCFVDNEVWPLKVRYVGQETIKIKHGKYNCLVFRPVVQEGRIFKKEEDMTVWVTNDQNKIPVQAKAKILVGSITMELRHYSGVANPVNVVKP